MKNLCAKPTQISPVTSELETAHLNFDMTSLTTSSPSRPTSPVQYKSMYLVYIGASVAGTLLVIGTILICLR